MRSLFASWRRAFLRLARAVETRALLLSTPRERQTQFLQARAMLLSALEVEAYGRERYREEAPFREALRRRPLSPHPRVNAAIAFDFGQFMPHFRPEDVSADERRARQAHGLVCRGKPKAALRVLDALIARLERRAADDSNTALFLTNVQVFAGAVGYMIDDETAGAYYAAAVGRAENRVSSLLVLGAILLRLGRIDDARTAWKRAFVVEKNRWEASSRGADTLGKWESLQDEKVELDKLEAMIAGLDVLHPRS